MQILFASLPFTIPTAQLSEEKATLTAAAETPKADVDFSKQQLHYVQVGSCVYAVRLYCVCVCVCMCARACVCVCVLHACTVDVNVNLSPGSRRFSSLYYRFHLSDTSFTCTPSPSLPPTSLHSPLSLSLPSSYKCLNICGPGISTFCVSIIGIRVRSYCTCYATCTAWNFSETIF